MISRSVTQKLAAEIEKADSLAAAVREHLTVDELDRLSPAVQEALHEAVRGEDELRALLAAITGEHANVIYGYDREPCTFVWFGRRCELPAGHDGTHAGS